MEPSESRIDLGLFDVERNACMVRLGVNIDHVATLRQARGGREPDPVWAAVLAELGGADGITIHLREDRRHIQDRDLRLLRETVQVRLNLEAAAAPEIVAIALEVRPDQVTFVPERRAELTTEGGLDVVGQRDRVGEAVARCRGAGLEVSLFIDPEPAQVEISAKLGAAAVEMHTGRYADAVNAAARDRELAALCRAGEAAVAAGLALHAGHGLNYQNVGPVARLASMAELNIGHSIVSRAVFVGFERAVREMKDSIDLAIHEVAP
jgi:pyridoxine 5-phosphate synthase